MSGVDSTWLDRADASLKTVEAWLSAFIVSLMASTIGIVALLAVVDLSIQGNIVAALAFGVVLVGWAVFDTKHLYWTWSCLRRRDRPLAPAVAMRQPPVRPPLRPLVAAWWLIHFAMGVTFILASEQVRHAPGHEQDAAARFGVAAITFVFAFAYALAAHGYLLMMVSALAPRRDWVETVWRWRLAIDLGFVVLSMLAPWPTPKTIN